MYYRQPYPEQNWDKHINEELERDKQERIEKEKTPKRQKGYSSVRKIVTFDLQTFRQLKTYCKDIGLPMSTVIRSAVVSKLIDENYRKRNNEDWNY